jgi:hypothetical protein
MQDLAQDNGYEEIKGTLSAALDAWLDSENDPGAAVDTVKALQAARQGKHLHGKHAN